MAWTEKGLKAIAEDARIEDRNHFEALVPRIYELGGALPRNMNDFHDISACPPAYLPDDPTDIQAMLKVLVNAERCAVKGYTEVCNMTAGKDHRTYELSLAILHEEIEHEAWFAEFLGEGHRGTEARATRPDIRPTFANSCPNKRTTGPQTNKKKRAMALIIARFLNVLLINATSSKGCSKRSQVGLPELKEVTRSS